MKAKKVLAMLMASAMIMGTSVTAFAAPTSTNIEVVNLGEDAIVNYLQIIEPDTTSPTGWKFVNETIESAYVSAFNTADSEKPTGYTAEQVIWMLLENKTPGSDKIPEDISAASASQIQKGVEAVEKLPEGEEVDWTEMGVSGTTATASVSEAGIYAIKAVDGKGGITYVYSAMAAYVAFAGYDPSTGVPSSLTSEDVNAKKTTLDITKSSDETDDVVAIGDTVTYTVETVVPYVADNVVNPVYTITDSLTGAKYDMIKEGENAGKVELTVTVGEGEGTTYYSEPVVATEDKQEFTVDLSNIVKDRNNANQKLTITYSAIVTGEVVNNTVQPGDGNNTFDDILDGDTLYTGKITVTKLGEKPEGGEAPKLEGAEFVLYYEANDKTYYAEFDEAENFADNAHEYIFTGKWIEEEEEGVVPDGATHIVTDSDGEAVVRGLDDDTTYSYMFKEVVAPDGYSINASDAPAAWDKTGDGAQAATRAGSASMNDTKLSSLPLPSTGGIGTTLFTVGGCTIMVVAAGLYFATRKKEEN